MVVPSGALDVNSLRILKNDSSRETSIPVGTVIGCVYHIDSVATIPPKETASSDFDESMINFGESPISKQWKNRLCKKLAQKSHVFSMHGWDVGLARGVEHRIRTIPDQYTTPCIEDALNALTGSQWFSVLDLRSGYYQIAMSEEDKEKTAFICPLGFFQFE